MNLKKETPEQKQIRFVKNNLKHAFDRAQREMPKDVLTDDQEILSDVCTTVMAGIEPLMEECKVGLMKLERKK